MKNSRIFKIIGVVVAIIGFVSGIAGGFLFPAVDMNYSKYLGLLTKTYFNFVFMFTCWVSTAFLCIFIFGIAYIIEYLEMINIKLYKLENENKSSDGGENIEPIIARKQDFGSKSRRIGTLDGEWKCPKCGRINANYVGTCGCGKLKP